MRTVKQLTDNKFLNIKEVSDSDFFVKGFQFAERRGVNSIAFICFDKISGLFLLNRELKPPVGSFVLGAFGGSIDKDKTLDEIVLDEVREEAGFSVDKEQIKALGKVLVSTQMNQWCHLYLVFVNKDEQEERHPENRVEELAKISWHYEADIWELEDWKPMAIVSMAQAQLLI
jgi:8-oxo-dGTP pyrophosphatase MutT (NUDIX family)